MGRCCSEPGPEQQQVISRRGDQSLTEFDLFNNELVFSFSQFVFTYSLVDFTFFQHAGVDDTDDLFDETADDFVIFCGAYGEFGSTYDELCAHDDDSIVVIA